MFRDLRDYFINLVTSRLFVLIVCVVAMGGTLIYRIFDLQIVNGESYLNNFTLKIKKERSIAGTRGNIYDRNGDLLAYNELAYSVTIEDVYESGNEKNANLNQTILDLIRIIENNNDKIINDFNIILDKDNNYVFNVEDKQLLRFLADVYGCAKTDKLKYAQKTATPDEVMDYLAGTSMFGIGTYKVPGDRKSFVIGDGYTKSERLKLTTIRYAMNANSYQKYIPTQVAADVSDETVAVVMENSDSLEGVSIAEDTIRKYVDSTYFSHIIGYTGKISTDELDTLKKEKDSYDMNDMIGKAGIEQVMETKLQGTKGSETVYVDNLGKVIETSNKVNSVAGNNLYLTIDKELQKATYNILEQKIAGILVSKIRNVKEYVAPENASASSIIIPIDDVYFALINNNIIDIAGFQDKNATETEKAVYSSYMTKQNTVFERLKQELTDNPTVYSSLNEEYQVYESYIVSMLSSSNKGILDSSKIDTSDATYIAWRTDESISLKEYLNYAIAMNWINISKLNLTNQYADSDEIYQSLLTCIFDNLENNTEFSKKLYKYMIKENTLTGKQVCTLLMDQELIDINATEVAKLQNGSTSAYAFILQRIADLDITPAQLALDPCSGSSVITDVNTGEVLAMVTYPSYDNNRLANSIDADYYNQLQSDLSLPMWDYATQQLSAPGSTFKMVSASAALEEGVTGLHETVRCTGTFEKVTPSPRCWLHSGHGALDIAGAIQHSCNFFFYEMGYRLEQDNTGSLNSDYGLERLAKYADLYGLSDKSGVEIEESTPHVSDQDAVRSAIGQGTSNYTTAGLARYVTAVANSGTCYNLSLIDKLTDANGAVLEDYTPEVRNQIDLAPTSWNAIHSGMRRVVQDKAYYSNLGVNVAGKTGTAQENRNRANHALFVGYAPYEKPEIAIATRIAFGYTSDYAAEISRDIIKYYFNLEDESDIITGNAVIPDAQGNATD
ncbi:MAG: penicillin-binding transpeptidase domain-containing protein [Lachnospiraceae bacterium]|nr:penicillin-binding transpeptidase domain-containing protein [Lachnospiraceae bacterium]